MRKLLKAFAVLLVLAGISLGFYFGLITHRALAAGARPAAAVPAALDALYRCDPSEPVAVTVMAATDVDGAPMLEGKVRVRRAGRPSAHEDTLWFYRAIGLPEGKRAPTLVVTPILGGDHDIERIIAHDLMSHGYNAVIVERRLPTEPKLEAFDDAFRDMIAARRRVIDWLETRSDVDGERIGAYGVSLGGITTAMLAGLEPRLKACVLVMAGGDLPWVLSGSVEGEAVALRHAYGLGDAPTQPQLDEFIAKGRAVIASCPLKLAPYADPRKEILFTTRRDTSVPSPCQDALEQALGGPETFSFPTGHYSAIIYLPIITNEARRFLAERFAEVGSAPAPAPATGAQAPAAKGPGGA